MVSYEFTTDEPHIGAVFDMLWEDGQAANEWSRSSLQSVPFLWMIDILSRTAQAGTRVCSSMISSKPQPNAPLTTLGE